MKNKEFYREKIKICDEEIYTCRFGFILPSVYYILRIYIRTPLNRFAINEFDSYNTKTINEKYKRIIEEVVYKTMHMSDWELCEKAKQTNIYEYNYIENKYYIVLKRYFSISDYNL